MNMAQLADLQKDYPLSSHWGPVEAFEEDVDIAGHVISTVGFASTSKAGHMMTGSAAQVGLRPIQRAYFELIERTAIFEADMYGSATSITTRDDQGQPGPELDRATVFPQNPTDGGWRFAKSNGVAAHLDWNYACLCAQREVIERDRVLRSWFGEIKPRLLSLPSVLIPHGWELEYEFQTCVFDPPEHDDEPLIVAMLIGFPRAKNRPIIYGFGARESEEEAVFAATVECFQRLGFLWDQGVPEATPEFSPTPDYHQDVFLMPNAAERLRAWLRGRHDFRSSPTKAAGDGRWLYVDLTPTHLVGKLYVVKALNANRLPLIFGYAPFDWMADIPREVLIHPLA